MRKPIQERRTESSPQSVSFAADVLPMFKPYQGQMMWRFDLTDYQAMVANAQHILSRIASPGSPMPPPPFDPLSREQIDTFRRWVDEGCPP